jgi:hypothetical protein
LAAEVSELPVARLITAACANDKETDRKTRPEPDRSPFVAG